MSTPSERAISARRERKELQEAIRIRCPLSCTDLTQQYSGRALNLQEYAEAKTTLATGLDNLIHEARVVRESPTGVNVKRHTEIQAEIQDTTKRISCLDKYYNECQPQKEAVLQRELHETRQGAQMSGMHRRGEEPSGEYRLPGER